MTRRVTTKGRKIARQIAREYAQRVGRAQANEPFESIASDLITDLLLTFDMSTAELIMDRVRRDNFEDRSEEELS